ncbi:MAG: restriction endonuclease subunit S, partial [Ignavibacteria bacterium]|nr:restriction endonuclease subunit S [Ignavibacteria bacterium]
DFPNSEGKPYKSSGGKMVWNEELKREVPEGWKMKRLKEFADTSSGGTPLSTNSEYYENGNIPWINSGEVNEPFIVNARKFITTKGLENSSAKLFKRGTILMAMYGATAGKVSIIDIEATTNQAICGIIPQQEDYKMYIKFGLEDMYRYLVNLSTGSARDNLSQDKIKDLQFIIPEKPVLKTFDKTANAAMSKILLNMKENHHLSSLRDWILPMLMNGQVKANSGYEGEAAHLIAAEPEVEYAKSSNTIKRE